MIVVLCTGLVAFMVACKFGAVLAVNQSVVKPRMRSLASSIQGFCASIIAVGGGPLFVGALNDALTPSLGEQAIRYSLGLRVFHAARRRHAPVRLALH